MIHCDVVYFVLNLEEHCDVVYYVTLHFRKIIVFFLSRVSINKLDIWISVFWLFQRARAFFRAKEGDAKTLINFGWPKESTVTGARILSEVSRSQGFGHSTA